MQRLLMVQRLVVYARTAILSVVQPPKWQYLDFYSFRARACVPCAAVCRRLLFPSPSGSQESVPLSIRISVNEAKPRRIREDPAEGHPRASCRMHRRSHIVPVLHCLSLAGQWPCQDSLRISELRMALYVDVSLCACRLFSLSHFALVLHSVRLFFYSVGSSLVLA